MAQRVEDLGRFRNVRISDNSLAYLILALFGLTIINTAIMQSDLNKIANAPTPMQQNYFPPRYY